MIGYWHEIASAEVRSVAVALAAHVGGHELMVERFDGEHCWRWIVLSGRGREIEGARRAHRGDARRGCGIPHPSAHDRRLDRALDVGRPQLGRLRAPGPVPRG
jgi:hypothetical protein